MDRWLFAVCSVLCFLLVLGGFAGSVGGTALAVDESNDSQPTVPNAVGAGGSTFVDDNFTSTDFVLTVYPNRSIRWTFEHKTPLTSDSRREWFSLYAEEFRTNETEAYRQFERRAEALVANAETATGRSMNASDFRKNATVSGITDNLGVVRMSFLWSNFTRHDDGSLLIDDVFRRGIYIGPNQSFVVERGPGLTFVSVEPQPDSVSSTTVTDSVSVTWEGERDFNDFRPRAELRPQSTDGETVTTDAGSGPGVTTESDPNHTETTVGPGTGPPGDNGQSPSEGNMLLTVAIVTFGIVFLAVAVLGLWLYRREWLPGTAEDDGTVDDPATVEERPVDQSEPSSTQSEAATEGDQSPDLDAEADTASRTVASVDESDVVDEQFRSDEDWVISILEDEGGRMKQSAIVEETDWSKSKVSMLLSNMEEDGDISKLRVGRENIISLPGKEPEAAGSPFDDEDDEPSR